MHAPRHQKNHSSKKEFPDGGNPSALSLAAEKARDIMDGRLTREQLEAFSGLSGDEYLRRHDEEWLLSLDPKPLIELLETQPDKRTRIRIMRAVEKSGRYLIQKHPECLGRFIQTAAWTAEKYGTGKSAMGFDDPLYDLGHWSVNYREVDAMPPEEFCDFYDGYARVLPSFGGRCEYYKVEHTLESAMNGKYWKKLFLWLESLENPSGMGIFEYGNHVGSVFPQVTEEEILFLANFLPKGRRMASIVISKYVESKNSLSPSHTETWNRIAAVLRDNPLAEDIIHRKIYFMYWKSQEWLTEEKRATREAGMNANLENLEFLAAFGRKLNGSKSPRNILQGVETLQKQIEDPVLLENLFQLIARQNPENMAEYCFSIGNAADRLPPLEILEELLVKAESLCQAYHYPDERHAWAYLDYLIRYAEQPESVETLERYLQANPASDSLKIIRILPKEYQTHWDVDPIYASALRNRPKIETEDREEDRVFANQGIELFVALCRRGLSIAECEETYRKIARSRDA